MKNANTATITLRDLIYTLPWLADRGYDGGIYDALEVEDGPTAEDEGDLEDDVLVSWDEPAADDVARAAEDDPCAFLACNASATISNLADRILGFS